jgi:hypothetical protein
VQERGKNQTTLILPVKRLNAEARLESGEELLQ